MWDSAHLWDWLLSDDWGNVLESSWVVIELVEEVAFLLEAIHQRIELETYRRMLERVQAGSTAHLQSVR